MVCNARNLAILILCLASAGVNAQPLPDSITIVSDPDQWYVDTPEGMAPSPQVLIDYPQITTIPGSIPQHWNVTRLDPWTQAKVVWLQGNPIVVTWGASRVRANWHEYHTPFTEMARNKSYYTRADLPVGHSMEAEFHLADKNHDGRIDRKEHAEFFGAN